MKTFKNILSLLLCQCITLFQGHIALGLNYHPEGVFIGPGKGRGVLRIYLVFIQITINGFGHVEFKFIPTTKQFPSYFQINLFESTYCYHRTKNKGKGSFSSEEKPFFWNRKKFYSFS